MTGRQRPRGHLLSEGARRTLGHIALTLGALAVLAVLQAVLGDLGIMP